MLEPLRDPDMLPIWIRIAASSDRRTRVTTLTDLVIDDRSQHRVHI